jgi:RNA polymerase sigma-54 factor
MSGLGTAAPLEDFGIDQRLAAQESLEALLTRTIEAVFSDAPADKGMALALLANLDEAGYVTVPLAALTAQLGAAPAELERVLQACQSLAPTGVFARSLAECLELQLVERDRLTPPMQTLLANLPRLAAGERAALAALCGVGREGFEELVAEIRALDPKPGLAFAHESTPTLIPDVFVRPAPGGGWVVELNDQVLPRLLVNRAYFAQVSARTSGEAERRYFADCLQKASWLEKSLDQRARTVLKVATEIVRRQDGFLADGVAYLKPLNLRMVADALGIHESTVSRAAANKTIATPRGTFEFRYFFTGAIAATSGGEAHSAEAVKHRIRKMILEEAPDAVLSDDAIVVILSGQGVEIARRTVAKYRELMRIGSSVERRREKRLKAAS